MHRVIKLMFVLALVLGVVSSTAYSAQSPAKVVVSHWSFSDDLQKLHTEAARAVGVEPEYTLYSKGYQDKLVALSLANTLPDVVGVDDTTGGFWALMALNSIAPVNNSETFFKGATIPDSMYNLFAKNGQIYGVPTGSKMTGMFINLTMLDNVGLPLPNWNWDWNDYLTYCKRLTQDINGDGIPEVYGSNVNWNEQTIGPFLWSNGGGILNADKTASIFDSPATIEALEFLQQLVMGYRVLMPGDNGSFWSQQKLGIYPNGSWNLANWKQLPFDWDFIPYPISPNTGKRAAYVGVGAFSIAKSANDYEAALRFIETVISREVQLQRLALGVLPVRIDVMNSSAFYPSTENPKNARKTIVEAFTDYAHPETVWPSPEMKTIAVNAMRAILENGDSVRNTLTQASEQLNVLLKQ